MVPFTVLWRWRSFSQDSRGCTYLYGPLKSYRFFLFPFCSKVGGHFFVFLRLFGTEVGSEALSSLGSRGIDALKPPPTRDREAEALKLRIRAAQEANVGRR